MAPCDLVFITDAIGVGIVQAVAVAVEVVGGGVGAGFIVNRGFRIEIARIGIRTAEQRRVGTEVECVTEFIPSIAFNENLRVHLATEVASGRELTDEHFEVIAGHTIGVAIQCIPGSTDGVVDGDVASGKTTARVEVGCPWVVRGLDRAHIGLTYAGIRHTFQSDRDPGVIDEIRVDRKQQAVDAIRCCSSQGGVIE